MDYIPINFDLLKNPLNWFTVLLMVSLLMLPLVLLHDAVHTDA